MWALWFWSERLWGVMYVQDGSRGGDVRDHEGRSIRLQSWHLVAGHHADRAGSDRAAPPRAQPHEGPAKNRQGWASHPGAAFQVVSHKVLGAWEWPAEILETYVITVRFLPKMGCSVSIAVAFFLRFIAFNISRIWLAVECYFITITQQEIVSPSRANV